MVWWYTSHCCDERDIIEYALLFKQVESCPSGWRSTPGKRVYGDTVPRVRISHSPPFFYLKTGSFHRFIWMLAGFRCILDCSILVLRKAVSWTSSGPEGSSDKWIAVCAARVPGCCGPMYNDLTPEGRLFLCLKILPLDTCKNSHREQGAKVG